MYKISKVLIFLTIFLMPLYVIRFAILGIPITFLEIMLILTVLTVLYECIKAGELKLFFGGKINYLILVFLASAIIGLLVTPDLRGGLGIFKAYFVEPILFFYALRYILIKEKSYTFVIRGLILGTSLICLLGLIQKLTGQFSLAPQEMLLGRISGVYNSANAVALFIGPIIPFLAVLFIKHRDRFKKMFFLGLLIFYSLIMYWTKSRGGLVAEVFSLSILLFGFLTLRYKEVKKYWFLLFIAFVILVGLFFIQVNHIYFEKTLGDSPIRIQNDTIQIRYATWISTLRMLTESSERVIFGAGLNGFPSAYERYKLVNFPEDFQYPHMILLTFWSESGLLGLISFSAILIYIFALLIRLNRKQTDFFALALIGSFSFMIVHGLVDVPYFKNDLSLQFWVLVALVEILAIQKLKKGNI